MKKELNPEDARDLLRRYRLGKCTDRERLIVEQWYKDLGADSGDMQFDDARLAEVEARTFQRIVDQMENAPRGVVRFLGVNRTVWLRAAAVLMVGMVAALLYLRTSHGNKESAQFSLIATQEGTMGDTVVHASKSATYLSDGTVVWLKGNSRLTYPRTFDNDSRVVRLVGEAFFDVAHDPDRPFIIHSANFTTRVLGTSFNIRDFGQEAAQEVAVVSGRVVVSVKSPSGPTRELVLHPNKKAVYSRLENTFVEQEVKPVDREVFRRKKLHFEEVRLDDILAVLNATHDVEISVKNEDMRDCIITADLTDVSLEIALEIISKAINASYSRDGSSIVLDGDGCYVQP